MTQNADSVRVTAAVQETANLAHRLYDLVLEAWREGNLADSRIVHDAKRLTVSADYATRIAAQIGGSGS